MRLLVRSLLLVLALSSASALAQRKLQEFREANEMTPEEIAQSKKRKSNLNEYGRDVSAEVTPVPWMAIGLSTLAILVAVPFGLRAYRETATEIEGRSR